MQSATYVPHSPSCYNFIVVQYLNCYAPSGRPTCSTATAPPCCSRIEHNAGLTGAIGPSQAKVWRKSTDGRRDQSEPPFSPFLSFIPFHPTNKLTHLVDSALAQESLFRRRPLTSTLNYPIASFPSLSSDVQLRAQCEIADFQSRRDELQKAVDDYIENILGSDCWPLQTTERKRRGSRATRRGMKR